ncbi:MAG: hypothetical protein F6J94_01455 [Moorea sp. SIO1F2]|uniref:hypothetical protein n=1 Tax=unclassified Moorena TaxID=2683338 RepID=UPI0013BD6D1A|nr:MULTISPECIES: hypothetical protein [unclassified Moorena]NEN95311.1 hypothetical protein [Moorena sp. SIO3I7]NEO08119.1 hypothetical protein [Moorena sp. SIO3I8]NEO23098.1 hypothetical protein [Moorena sp. SIO4A5]NEP24775.1 hypothetical protein [Moorena sp. SIO3I6]NEQ57472.1 hypothetical protein [Moorena sp. SIO4A1]
MSKNLLKDTDLIENNLINLPEPPPSSPPSSYTPPPAQTLPILFPLFPIPCSTLLK